MAVDSRATATALPLPRTNVRVLATVIAGLSVLGAILAMMRIVAAGGRVFVKDGGSGMFVILGLAVVLSVGFAVLAGAVVRGRQGAALIVCAVPAIPAAVGVLFFSAGIRRTIGAVAGANIPPELGYRILAAGIAESDALLVLGCFVSGLLSITGAAALLGSAAAVDRVHAEVAGSNRSRVALAFGAVSVLLAIGVRVSLHTTARGSPWAAVPALSIVVAFASLAAARGLAGARAWIDRPEARSLAASVLAAALLAALGVALLDVSALFAAERAPLRAIAYDSVSSSQRMVLLAEAASETRATLVLAIADGLLAATAIAIALAPVVKVGRAAVIAAACAALLVLSMVGTRTWAFDGLGVTSAGLASLPGGAIPREVDLPNAPKGASFERGSPDGPRVVVDADGKITSSRELDTQETNIVLVVDRRAPWRAVAAAIQSTLARRPAARLPTGRETTRRLPTLAIKILSPDQRDRVASLGPYALFADPFEPTIHATLEDRFYPPVAPTWTLEPEPAEAMGSVVARILSHAEHDRGTQPMFAREKSDRSW